MDTETVARLGRAIGGLGTRRAVVGALLGAVMAETTGNSVARGKRNRRRRRGNGRHDSGPHAGRVQAESQPVVIGPERETGLEEGFVDCGAFVVDDRFDLTFTLRLFFDKAGNLVKGVEQVSGTDTFINASTGKELTGRFHNNVIIDFTVDPPLGANVGVIYKVTVPGAGAVFLDVGRIVTDQSGDIVAFQAGPHQFFDGDVDGLCAALA